MIVETWQIVYRKHKYPYNPVTWYRDLGTTCPIMCNEKRYDQPPDATHVIWGINEDTPTQGWDARVFLEFFVNVRFGSLVVARRSWCAADGKRLYTRLRGYSSLGRLQFPKSFLNQLLISTLKASQKPGVAGDFL